MSDVFDESDDYYTGPPLVGERVREAEALLGVRLPRSYLTVLQQRNGGVLRHGCCPTDFPTSWAEDHFEVRALLGIGGVRGIDSTTGQGSVDLVREWGYPDIGVVICDLPSAGHDTVMLDYTDYGPAGEPAVVYVDEDRLPRRVADTFEQFLSKLRPCDGME